MLLNLTMQDSGYNVVVMACGLILEIVALGHYLPSEFATFKKLFLCISQRHIFADCWMSVARWQCMDYTRFFLPGSLTFWSSNKPSLLPSPTQHCCLEPCSPGAHLFACVGCRYIIMFTNKIGFPLLCLQPRLISYPLFLIKLTANIMLKIMLAECTPRPT